MSADKKNVVTMKQVADVAGVSQATISMALREHPRISESQRIRIRQICEELGYRNLRPGRVRRGTLSFSLPARIGFITVGVPQGSTLLHPVSLRCQEYNSRLEVLSLPEPHSVADTGREIIEFSRHLDGVILTDFINQKILALLHHEQIPYVVIGHTMRDPGELPDPKLLRCVTCDETDMGRFASHTLFNRGHHQLFLICGNTPPNLYNARWRDGFRLAHADRDLPPGRELVEFPDLSTEARDRALEQALTDATPPTGFLMVNSLIARHALDAATRIGRPIPPDALIIGDFPEQVASIGLQGCGILAPDFKTLAAQALHLLARQHAGDRNFHGEVVVPFLTYGLGE
ncbi:MAG: hypothetical protein A2498_12240 [Lentisphaerae bacterium RIFOXYC12_FULL_60_16]|nr:MAG: hypothetical protein A2498_12240 [Lentisphaerae bacterium RIFOXYC12_FULL_60_16]OGV69788.1 MAG: hypothetical protein A2269_08320 [Lentisphaerae bacterium RIFOXYA12_FULL_60_10]OGV78473.1 MAG: hypothetical protein A2340_07670 [Lentisphaerae bacterium RIFOXYB12_FULL_60_10]